MDERSPDDDLQELLKRSGTLLPGLMFNAFDGYSTHLHQIDNSVTFILDHRDEIPLQVRCVEVLYTNRETGSRAEELKVYCLGELDSVLKLAKKLRMKMRDFDQVFTVILTARPEFVAEYSDVIANMFHVRAFFETLDDMKRPVFNNLDHYVISRISS